MHGIAQPSAADVLALQRLHVSRHPAVAHKLSRLRRRDTGNQAFHELLGEIGALLAYEALADLSLRETPIRTPMGEAAGYELRETVGLVPILRAGLGLVAPFRQLAPTASVWHLGLHRDEHTLQPVEYSQHLPERIEADLCLILDPMLATGGSAVNAARALRSRGSGRVKLVGVIAAPYGVQQLNAAFPDIDIHVAALDRELNEQGYILPGLGDAGDRQFGTA
ncbi:MAG: uracil phosphoribosyltransferase [Chloroflexi bacterium]|nr:uracil phosphoribosyltransferase [Chloroflexota bacterium]